ncbi:protein kinase [Streptomyces sp. NPDC005890]|uniref:protein kinase domain-containing protein n=1 Tax=Streptomyces sp. NPDC005890 TaxID=3154568 RepID=UPI0033F1DB88
MEVSHEDGAVPSVWSVGDVIDGRYQVTEVLGRGSMGVVYRVRHLGWGTDLAVKSPRPALFRSAAARELFVTEAETWVSLGLHPNVCGCHYVRTLGGIPRVFAEYVPGGSLRDWIVDRRLYRGDRQRVLARILDVAVQMAWGLEHAHRQGLVQQDVKPGNVLLDSSGTAKITDFGLALARKVAGTLDPDVPPDASTLQPGGGGMTLAYASPEQVENRPLGRRTDIFSFAVSVLEMFTGAIIWDAGPAAGAALADCRAGGTEGLPAMPSELADLLASCLHEDPALRPARMTDVVAALLSIYEDLVGHPYPRPAPVPADFLADEFNNRALSLFDLGRPAEAEQAFTEALRADPQHLTATYNAGLLRWRRGHLTDEELLTAITAPRDDLSDPWQIRHLSALVHMERGDVAAARQLLQELARERPDDPDLLHAANTSLSDEIPDAQCFRNVRIPWQTYPSDSIPTGHDIRLTPDGRLGLTSSADHSVRLWDIHTGVQLKSLQGHTNRVDSVDISADGRYAISTGWDETVRFWDLAVGKQMRSVPITPWADGKGPEQEREADRQNELAKAAGRPHYTHVTRLDPGAIAESAVRLNRDGSVALWGEADGRIQVWDFPQDRHLLTLDGHPGGQKVEVSPLGQWALSGNGTVLQAPVLQLWDLTTGDCVWRLDNYEGGVRGLWFGPRGDMAAVLGDDHVIRVWDLAQRRCVHTLALPRDLEVRSVALSLDSRFLLVGSWCGKVTWWDLQHNRCLRTFVGHQDKVIALLLTTDNQYGVSASLDNTTRVWRLPGRFEAPAQVSRPRQHGQLVWIDERMEALVTQAEAAQDAGRVGEAIELLVQARALPGCERAPRVLGAWRTLGARATRTGPSAAWPAKTLEAATPTWLERGLSGARSRTFTSIATPVDLTADARLGVLGDNYHQVQIWNLAQGRRERVIDPGLRALTRLRLTPDGRRMVVTGQGAAIKTFSVESGECLDTLYFRSAHPVAFSADARLALVVDRAAASMLLWDLEEHRELQALPSPGRIVTALWLASDGRRAVSASCESMRDGDSLVCLWDLTSGQRLLSIPILDEQVSSVCLSSDGRFVITGSAPEISADSEQNMAAIRMWNAVTGDFVRIFDLQQHFLSDLCLSDDGLFVFTSGVESAVRVWNAATGRCMRTLDGHQSGTAGLAITPDANFAFTADGDQTLRLWELDWDLKAPRPSRRSG